MRPSSSLALSTDPRAHTLTHRAARPRAESKEPQFTIKPTGSKATVAAWCSLDELIVTAHEDGTLNLWDTVRPPPSLPVSPSQARAELTRSALARSQEEGLLFFDKEERGHSGLITDLQMSPDGTYFVTSSKDKSAKVRRARPSLPLSSRASSADARPCPAPRSGPSARTRTRTARRST